MKFEWKITSEINSLYIKTPKYHLTIYDSSWFWDSENN